MTDLKWPESTPLTRLLTRVSVWIDQKVGWDHLSKSLGLFVLIGERILLRQKNLHDTGGVTKEQRPPLEPLLGIVQEQGATR